MTKSAKPVCTKCHKSLAKILYGYPASDAFAAARREEVYLGGCMTFGEEPTWHCYQCNRNYYEDLQHFACAPISMIERHKLRRDVAQELSQLIPDLPDGTTTTAFELAKIKYTVTEPDDFHCETIITVNDKDYSDHTILTDIGPQSFANAYADITVEFQTTEDSNLASYNTPFTIHKSPQD